MFKNYIPYSIIFLLVVSCYKFKEPEKPKNLISKSDMVNILIDLKIMASITGAGDMKVLDSNNVRSEKYIYKKYNIDSTQFALSNNYYAFHLDDYEDIYKKVADSLESLSRFYEEVELREIKEKKSQDSIKALSNDENIN